jgi:hypothetical protein
VSGTANHDPTTERRFDHVAKRSARPFSTYPWIDPWLSLGSFAVHASNGECVMSIGSHHRLEGLLITSARGFVLSLADGGIWALNAAANAKQFLGQHATIEGVRSGFDRIDVPWIGKEEMSV